VPSAGRSRQGRARRVPLAALEQRDVGGVHSGLEGLGRASGYRFGSESEGLVLARTGRIRWVPVMLWIATSMLEGGALR